MMRLGSNTPKATTGQRRNARLDFPSFMRSGRARPKSELKTMTDGLCKYLQFGPFELSIRERVLRRDGVALTLGDRALDILIYLAERPGEVVAKREIMDHVWPDVTVEEGSIRVHVAAIRKALRDGQFGNGYIANIKGRGYAFVGTIVAFGGGMEGAAAEEFRGQVRFIDLGSLTDPHHVAEAVATSLRFAVDLNDPGLEPVDRVRLLKLIIILDSCEHAIKAVALVAEQPCPEAD
jgi:DNA-binding winged helix-turn-helix (wHTH) protein